MSWWSRLRARDAGYAATPPPYQDSWGPVYAVVPELRRLCGSSAACLIALAVSLWLVDGSRWWLLAGAAALVLAVALAPVQWAPPRHGLRIRSVPGPAALDDRWCRRGGAAALVVLVTVALLAVALALTAAAASRPYGVVLAHYGCLAGQLHQLRLLERTQRATGGTVVRLQHRPAGDRSAGGLYLLGATVTGPLPRASTAEGGRPATPYARPGP